jgi:hypothetical protein
VKQEDNYAQHVHINFEGDSDGIFVGIIPEIYLTEKPPKKSDVLDKFPETKQ